MNVDFHVTKILICSQINIIRGSTSANTSYENSFSRELVKRICLHGRVTFYLSFSFTGIIYLYSQYAPLLIDSVGLINNVDS